MGRIDKVLIANRGEIARRVMRSCRQMGLRTVAVYSEADAGAAHVADADEAVAIGPANARESYLVAARIIEAARATGAQAIHPGYGFLSENAAFARAVVANGLVWIGPDPASIELMGDKQNARRAAMDAGVPVVPGSGRIEPNALDGLEASAETTGFPLLVKAAGGGGGIGMRRVDAPEQLRAVVEATQSMAAKAFSNGAVYLERFMPRARHVEVQVFGFGDGSAIHLFERDCSMQRRFQKVIEETPAPTLPPEAVSRMAAHAVTLARATRYAGAGTVEFIVDAETAEFFFLEMNTRIQVEHPVTEMVTGRDLVAMQIALADGRLAAIRQPDVSRDGAAIEARIYSENPAKMFMPSPGPLTVFRLPETGDNIRVDSGYRQGDVVTTYYDPLLAKVIAHGADRETARLHLRAALQQARIEGIATNLSFLVACLSDPDFAAGRIDTGFIERRRKSLVEPA